MGIEPTWNFVEPHHGFEDQERHQVALRLQAYYVSAARGLNRRALARHLPHVSQQVHIWSNAPAISRGMRYLSISSCVIGRPVDGTSGKARLGFCRSRRRSVRWRNSSSCCVDGSASTTASISAIVLMLESIALHGQKSQAPCGGEHAFVRARSPRSCGH